MPRPHALPVVIATALAGIAPTGAASAPGRPATVLQFLDVTTSFQGSFQGAPRFGDTFAFHDALYTWHGTKKGSRVGGVDALGVFLGADRVQISAVAHLPGGTLDVYGISGNGRVNAYGVIGGTGRYATARGEVIVRNLGGQISNNSAVTVRLWQ
jgi:hypothetical protein